MAFIATVLLDLLPFSLLEETTPLDEAILVLLGEDGDDDDELRLTDDDDDDAL